MMRRALPLFVLGTIFSTSVLAAPFSGMDPRSMAMGGTGVASATGANAGYFNPALLAAPQKDEDFRLILPSIGMGVADPDELATELGDFEDGDVIDNFSNAIEAYNQILSSPIPSTPFQANQLKIDVQNKAANIVSSGNTLLKELVDLSDKALEFTLNGSAVVAMPNESLGWSVNLSSWAVGGMLLNVAQSDQDAINQVLTTIDGIADGSSFNDPNTLIDNLAGLDIVTNPTNTLKSALFGRGIVVAEIGISLAHKFELGGVGFSAGITPRYLSVETFDYEIDINETESLTYDEGLVSDTAVTADLGVARDFGNGWRAGFVAKNMIAQEFVTAENNTIELNPMLRAGVSHHTGWSTVALDVDLTENDPAGMDSATQYVAIGGELNGLGWLQIRAGYRANISENDRDVFTLGVGVSPFDVVHLDVAVAGNSNEAAASAQLGLSF